MIDIFESTKWQMTFGERAALEGVLASLAPRLAIEIGTAEGGSLQRIARHSERVHSFDLVAPAPEIAALENVTLHAGDSHALLPRVLGELSEAGQNVDFVLVDGDHSADGVERDLLDLLGSPALSRTAILIHDTLNEEVRGGLERVPYSDFPHVDFVDLDFVGGHLSRSGVYRSMMWGGLGLVLVGAERSAADPPRSRDDSLYALFDVVRPVSHALLAADAAGRSQAPADVVAEQGDLERARHALDEVQSSASWRITAPLRAARSALRSRGGRG